MVDTNDAAIQVRCSRKTLASLAAWFCDGGDRPRSYGELVRNAMEILGDLLIDKGLAPRFESSLEATKALEAIGLGSPTIRAKGKEFGKRNYFEQLKKEELVISQGDPFAGAKRRTKQSREEIEKEIELATKALLDRDSEVKKALEGVPEGSIIEEEE